MRSVKQRTNNFAASPISPLSSSIDLSSANNSRFGLPVYQQQLRSQQQPPISLLAHNNNQFNLSNNNNSSLIQNSTNTLLAPAASNNTLMKNSGFSPSGFSNSSPNLVQPKQEIGYSNMGTNMGMNLVQPKPDPEDHGIMNTLQELEKELLNDDEENQPENDAVSVITNSEWSETFQNLMSPDPSSSPNANNTHPGSGSASTSGSNNTTTTPANNNNMISTSPTSSTSSCCSTSASASPPAAVATPQVPAKQLISEAAAAISDGKIESAMEVMNRLSQVANSRGSSEQKLAFYMGHALRSRVSPTEHAPPVMELFQKEHMAAMYSLYELSHCFKFGLLAANLVMLEAITSALHEGLKIHVVDFDIGHGGQYINLLRALGERRAQSGSAVSNEVRITVVETEVGNGGAAGAEAVKDGLVKLAEKVGISLKFEALTRKISELTRESLGCEEGEAVVVNFAFKLYRVPDESVSMENLRDELLRRVKGLRPRAVTLVEQDLNANTAPFMTRVSGACEYYRALFDSLDSLVPRDNPDRVRVEEALGRKMANSVACEGRERVERAEVFGKWRARMSMAGFELKALSQSVAESMRTKLSSVLGGKPGFTVKEESGGVGFGWMGRTLTVASAWR